MTHLDVILNVVVQQPTQGCDLIRPDVKAHHSRNLLPVTLMQASVADGSDEGQQLLEAGDFGLALLCNLGGGFHHRLCSKGLHMDTQMQSEHLQVLSPHVDVGSLQFESHHLNNSSLQLESHPLNGAKV